MKLKNKKTGEIRELPDGFFCGDNLKKICEEWEDYEEPKGTYFINTQGDIQFWDSSSFAYPDDWTKEKQIGNYFLSREEAELAVHKLKAWKRLQNTGCKPIMWRWKQDYPNDACYVEVVLRCQFDSGVHDKELDLLFGGGE